MTRSRGTRLKSWVTARMKSRSYDGLVENGSFFVRILRRWLEELLAVVLPLLEGGLDARHLLWASGQVEDLADEPRQVWAVVVCPGPVGARDLGVLHVDQALEEGGDRPPAHC